MTQKNAPHHPKAMESTTEQCHSASTTRAIQQGFSYLRRVFQPMAEPSTAFL